MKKLLFILTVSLIYQTSFGQVDFEKEILLKIDIGYSTRWDIEQLFGKGESLDKHFLNPDNEQDLGKSGWVHANGIQYKEKGIAFICADDGEKISSIYLTPPFVLTLNKNVVQLGTTLLADAFPAIEAIKANTTGVSYYWSFSVDKYNFFLAKPTDHRNKAHYSEVPSFKDNIEYYKKQPISIVTINFYEYELFKQEFQETQSKLYSSRPLYAPKDVTHTNYFDMGFSDKIPFLMRPLYALTGGQKSERIKQGYWKEYGPNHKLVYEGVFKDNMEIGLFKYYDKDGNLERTKEFSELKINWIYFFVIGLILSILIVMLKKRKIKNAL